ncbi:MAG: hypothetical protein V4596_00165 [Bdellovibrionota bacterium]
MKTMFLILLFLMILSLNSFAQEGPRFLRVEKISAAKSPDDTSEISLSFEGKKAEIFRNSLPPISSSFPKLDQHINELVFLDEKTKKSIIISCANATVNENFKLNILDKTKCTIRLIKHDPTKAGIEEDYGNATELTSPICKK